MKRTLYSSLALGAVLGLASCASDEPLGNRQNDGSVTFTVALPEMATRAFGDAGTINCNELLYTVYDAEGNNIILPTETKTAFGQGVLTDNVTLQLVANQEYKIVFYAHNNGSQFSTYTDGKLTVDYTKANINSEIDDAFYVAYPFTADGTAKTVTLTRPFAQLNIGTDDLGEAAVQNILANITSTLTVSQGLKNSMDLIAGTTSVEGTLDDVTFTPAGAPAVNTDFPVTGYSNLLSAYLLVPDTQDMIDATYVLKNGEKEIRTLNLAATPVRMNYRTNVYGSLLTTQQPFNVEIEPNFEKPDFMVSTEEELADAVKKGGNIVLNKDITLTRPLVLAAGVPATITLNGNTLGSTCRHTVKAGEKLVIVGSKSDGTHSKVDLNTNYVAGFEAINGGDLELTGLDIKYTGNVPANNAGSLVFVEGTGSTITQKDCNLDPAHGSMYAISTNASVADQNVNINLEKVSIKPSVILATPVLINIPCHLVAKDCEFEGCNQAAVLRGGNYLFDNCTFTQTLAFDKDGNCTTTKNDIKTTFRNLRRSGWGNGDAVPLAGITMGNHSNSYQYPTVVEMKGCTVNIPEVARNTGDVEASLPAVYIYANQGTGLGVTFNYDNTTKINGELEAASQNITVNGTSK